MERRKRALNRFVRSKRGVTPVIAIILLLMMTVAAAGAAYLWITKIQKTITTQAEKQIMTSFQQGTLQVISAYSCVMNCTKDKQASDSTAGECSGDLGTFQMLDIATGKVFATDNVGSEGKTQGKPEKVSCQVQNHLCLLVRNTGNTVVRMSDLGAAQVVYELPEAPEMGERPLMSKYIGATFSIDDEEVCCRFSDISSDGKCGENKKSVASRETLILSFYGNFKDANSNKKRLLFSDAKDQRIIVSMNLPSGFKVAHQIV